MPSTRRGARRLGLAGLGLALVACNVQPRPFANSSTQRVGPLSVALELQPNPPRVGRPSELVFTLKDSSRPVGPGQGTCQLTLDMPKMPMNLQPLALDSDGDGRCRATYTFPMAGGWSAALRANGQAGAATFEFDVGP